MHVNDGVFTRQARQQLFERLGGVGVPGSLNGGGDQGRVAQEIGLVEADDLDACVRQARIDRRGAGEDDRPVSSLFEPQRAFNRHLGLPAGDGGMIHRNDDIELVG